MLKEAYQKKQIKKLLNYYFKEKNIKNSNNVFPFIEKIEFKKYGISIIVDIKGITNFKTIENDMDYIKQLFRAESIEMTNKEGRVIIICYLEPLRDVPYSKVQLSPYELLVGYNRRYEPIIVDMRKTPHLGIQGLSGSGKTMLVNIMLKNLEGANIVLLNCFKDDFKGISCRRINSITEIKKFLTYLLENQRRREKPLYIVLDEINRNDDKETNTLVKRILQEGRHLNIYLIGIGQDLTKTSCNYKNLFNVRICLRSIDSSFLNAFLGCSVEDTKLNQREFYIYSESVEFGETYKL